MSFDAAAIIQQEADRFAAALVAADPEQRVPTCPDWNAADLLWHLTEVHEFWSAVLATGATTDEEVQPLEEGVAPRPKDPDALPERRAAATAALLEQLAARADEEPAWFWYAAERTVGAVRRMQTHEATIHRVDAELTAGHPVTPIDAEVAAAGLQHVLRVMWPASIEWIPDWATLRPVAAVEVRPQGGGDRLLGISRWSGTRPRDGKEFDAPVGRLVEDPAEAEGLPRATVSGSALALDLWAWGREAALDHLGGRSEKVAIHGDPAAIDQLSALVAEGHD
ncbi:maleylpyruvate isomerase N-terminal domain-containing protein [Brachybacterium sp. YJGR34]|uniref:maleylpyruvate isomerase N-terminal domain-containing protein n=1 Tax=Brachybacterium sp. YJGR34 TaxID=2059911 RepID=UPI0013005589|nr:maleylpyruvate isomerase N-terminal domain-containing protein [Brachybacterium sp. YJGR34]